MELSTYQLPAQLSTYAAEVDWLYYVIFWISVAFFVGIVGVMGYFVVRYRSKPGVRAKKTGHSNTLEVAWTVLPLILLIVLFHWGFQSYVRGSVAPSSSLDIRVRGAQWLWEFRHPNGMEELNEVTLPVGTPIRFIMSSGDVLHSFFVPDFRVKQDVVPGRYSTLWFEATKTGKVQAYCTEYCGAPEGATGNVGHSAMLATLNIVDEETYEKFLEKGPAAPEGLSEAEWGKELVEKSGCRTCHGVDGASQMPAPNFKGLYMREEKMTSGKTIVADENYIRESILQPQAKIVSGYENLLMPPYKFGEAQLDAIIAYIKELSQE